MKSFLCILAVTLGGGWGARAADSLDYAREVKPLLQARCYSCHGALKQKAGLRLDTGAALRRGGKDGPVVLPDNPDSSRLLQRIASTNADERMPPEGEPLTDAQIEMLRRWISEGAVSPPDEKGETDPRDHWAFRQPVRPAIPAVTDPGSQGTNPIDTFISAGHQKRGLKPGPKASRELLLRRVYLDLIGLTPTRDEVRAFLADAAPDAYEQVVSRLLDSPRHGERWARHWMDIWRYADWYGRRHVPDVWNSAPQVWRWRDWIVRSLNADKGYDRMLVEMLAADEVAPENDEARVATGYLVRNWYALNPNQWMRDIVEHTGKAFLGLTFNCAHCHDHKYDPITHRDYFRFRAFFEPLQVRQDRVPGEPDPGPFQKYEYSANRKVVTSGMVSVFDENLDATTHLYLRGDERNLPDGHPTVNPSMPAFLGGEALQMERIDLPPVASYPGMKPFIRRSELDKHEAARTNAVAALEVAARKLGEATAAIDGAGADDSLPHRAAAFAEALAAGITWRQASNQLAVAEAGLTALRARIAADDARYLPFRARTPEGTPAEAADSRATAAAASRAERMVTLRQAQDQLTTAEGALALLTAGQAAAAARKDLDGTEATKEENDKAQADLQQAQEQWAAAQKAVETAEAALETTSTAYTPLTPSYPEESTGRRRALAAWMVQRGHPLTARVAVNHIWTWHFHAPLVASVFDFGRNGSPPTHPELLDWLAVELMEHGWSMKHLHRLIVTSRAYRRSSETPDTGGLAATNTNMEMDPGNTFLWRMNAGQMEAEVLRDSLLHLAGALDLTPVGYPLPNKDAEVSRSRSLYFECFPEPGGHSQFASVFDPPEPTDCYRRSQTIVPQQALALNNSRLSREQSRALARNLHEQFPGTDDAGAMEFITAAFEHVLARRPSADEVTTCMEFLQRAVAPPDDPSTAGGTSIPPDAPADLLQARAGLMHALLNHNDFVTIR